MTNENTSNPNFNEMPPDFKPWGMNINQFCMLMHLSQFAGFIFPFWWVDSSNYYVAN